MLSPTERRKAAEADRVFERLVHRVEQVSDRLEAVKAAREAGGTWRVVGEHWCLVHPEGEILWRDGRTSE